LPDDLRKWLPADKISAVLTDDLPVLSEGVALESTGVNDNGLETEPRILERE
jgi:hypothetical protein